MDRVDLIGVPAQLAARLLDDHRLTWTEVTASDERRKWVLTSADPTALCEVCDGRGWVEDREGCPVDCTCRLKGGLETLAFTISPDATTVARGCTLNEDLPPGRLVDPDLLDGDAKPS